LVVVWLPFEMGLQVPLMVLLVDPFHLVPVKLQKLKLYLELLVLVSDLGF
jgi:hypothetical protein